MSTDMLIVPLLVWTCYGFFHCLLLQPVFWPKTENKCDISMVLSALVSMFYSNFFYFSHLFFYINNRSNDPSMWKGLLVVMNPRTSTNWAFPLNFTRKVHWIHLSCYNWPRLPELIAAILVSICDSTRHGRSTSQPDAAFLSALQRIHS